MADRALSRRLTIFEGPDGSGKTTAAKLFAEQTGARYVHFNSLPQIYHGLARVYVEAMLPALLGYQDVVFDRSWLSELPYGLAFREGKDRLGDASRRMLERLALRCGASVIRCDPGWEAVRASFVARRPLEMLDNEEQLRVVYDTYATQTTDLPTFTFNYMRDIVDVSYVERPHSIEIGSAGAWSALTSGVTLVGQDYAALKDTDPFYRWPFASFQRGGCSQWLAQELERAEISEGRLFWVNADQPLELISELGDGLVVALGTAAATRLKDLGVSCIEVPHPQYHKRFAHRARYELIDVIIKALE